MNRNIYVQGLRGALALSLFFYHVANSGLPTWGGEVYRFFNQIVLSFEFGVELFFGVSGIVIVFAFRKSPTISHFLVDRISRIYPVLWVTVIIIFALSGFDPRHRSDAGPAVLLGNLLALPPLLPIKLIHPAAWTISYEFLFYLFFVVFGLLLPRLGKKVALTVVLLVGVAFICFHLRATPFLIGMAVAYAAERRWAWLVNFKYAGLAVLGALLCWYAGTQVIGFYYVRWSDLLVGNGVALLFYGLASGLTFMGLAGVYFGQGLFCRVLAGAWFQWLGGLSFSLYMWQAIMMAVIKKAMYISGVVDLVGSASQLLFLLLALPPTLMISRLSQIYLEGHATRYIRSRASRKMPAYNRGT
jgi:peptidoglycan/LPS O-acetylase OafA/YrhL